MTAKSGAHAWFPAEKVAYLLVYRQVRKGKDDRWVLCSGRVEPSELVDEIALAQRFNAGYFKVQARGLGGTILGAPHYVGIPDAEGKVPVQTDEEPAAPPSSDASGLVPMLLEWLKLQQAQFRDEIARAREDSRDNLAAFAAINEQTLKALGSIQGREDTAAADHRFESLSRRVEKLSEENAALRVELATASARRRGASSEDDFWSTVAAQALPKVLEVMSTPRRRGVSVEAVAAAQRRARAPAVHREPAPAVDREPAPAVDREPAPAVEGEVIDAPPELTDEERIRRVRVLGYELPPIDEVRAAVAAGPLSRSHRELFTVLRDAGLLPHAYRDALLSAL